MSTTDKYSNGVLHKLSANAEQFEPKRTNNFELYIPSLDSVKYNKGGKGTATNINSKDIILAVKDVTGLQASIEALPIKYGNATANYAGVPSFGTSQITFNDFLGIDVARALEAWWNKVFDLTTHKIGRKKDYAFTAYLIEYTPDGVVTRTWELHNCWINSFELGNYDNEDNSIRRVTCSFVYDWFNEASSVTKPFNTITYNA